ncbi:MAG: hypothetical protein IKT63_06290, partial [Oscillospiraceae bacterium]|nr:hypothetical protein [Oscillospiraceae bacterium]
MVAVMFTFSFGSAMAAATPLDSTKISEADVRAAINTAADAAVAAQKVALATAVDTLLGSTTATKATVESLAVTRTAAEAAFKAEVYDVNVAKIEAKRTEMLLAVNAAIRACTDYTGWFTTDTANTTEYNSNGYAVVDTTLAGYAIDTTYTAAATEEYTFTPADDIDTALGAAIAKEVFAAKVKAMEEVIAGVNPENYSKEYKGVAKSNYDLVVEAIAAANLVVSQGQAAVAAAAEADVWTTVVTHVGNFGTNIYTAGAGEEDPTGTFVETVAAIAKISDEPTEAAKLAWAQNLVLGALTKQINEYKSAVLTEQNNIIIAEQLKSAPKAKVIADANEKIADVTESAAAALEIVTYLVNDADDWSDLVAFKKYVDGSTDTAEGFTPTAVATTTTIGTVYYKFADKFNLAVDGSDNAKFTLTVPAKDYANDFGTYVGGVSTYSETVVVDIVELVADLKDEAELLKATVTIDGSEYVAIDEALEDAIWDAYYGNKGANLEGFTPESSLYNRQEALITDAEVKINGKKYAGVNSWAVLNSVDNGY